MSSPPLPHAIRWLNAAQFFTALNINIFKFILIFYLIEIQGEAQAKTITATIGIVFVMPFILFSHLAGILADRYSKQRVIMLTKMSEVFIMMLGIAAYANGSIPGLYAVMFCMSLQNTLFSPAKFGIIPELVPPEQLSGANAVLGSFTFIAIIAGTTLSSTLQHYFKETPNLSVSICVLIAAGAYLSGRNITKTPAKDPQRRFSIWFLWEIFKTVREASRDRQLITAILGCSYFWLIGAYIQANIIPYGIEVFSFSSEKSAYLFLITAFGIATGSLLAGKLSGRNIEFGIVPVGSIGMAAMCYLLSQLNSNQLLFAIVALFIMGASAGLFIIPLAAFIQYRSPDQRRGEFQAATNFLNFGGILLASLLILIFTQYFKLSAQGGFAAMGLLTLILTAIAICLLPDFLVRFIMVFMTRVFYRITVRGLENVPLHGPALLVSNHVSWVDGLAILSTGQRRIRFIMQKEIYHKRWLYPLARLMRMIPISARDSPKEIVAALAQGRVALEEGYLVCIFAEGMITRTGNLAGFQKGYRQIVKHLDVPIIPVYIGGAWGSIFSYSRGKLLAVWPQQIPYPIAIHFGSPSAPHTTPHELRLAVMNLAVDYFSALPYVNQTLAQAYIPVARHHWNRPVLTLTADQKPSVLTHGRLLSRALAAAEDFQMRLRHHRVVGIHSSSVSDTMIYNLAISILGKTSVNLIGNSTVDQLTTQIQHCGVTAILCSTSRHPALFKLKNLNLLVITPPGNSNSSSTEKYLITGIKARYIPPPFWVKSVTASDQHFAAIMMSDNEPFQTEVIPLTDHNILVNITSINQLIQGDEHAHILCHRHGLPSFNLILNLWYPLLTGACLTIHDLTNDNWPEGPGTDRSTITMIITNPAYLAHTENISRETFPGLKFIVIVTPHPLNEAQQAVLAKSTIPVLTAFGISESGSMIAMNVPDQQIDKVDQIGVKADSMGHPLPGVAVRIVAPDTGDLLPPSQQGRIQIRGGNVINGYLNSPTSANAQFNNGWYDTGKLGMIDEDGFLYLFTKQD